LRGPRCRLSEASLRQPMQSATDFERKHVVQKLRLPIGFLVHIATPHLGIPISNEFNTTRLVFKY